MKPHEYLTTINSRKFDGKIHRSWKAKLIEQNQSIFTFIGIFEKEVKHQHLGVIRPNTLSYEFYWINRWFNIFRFHEPEGELRNFYCNVNMPPKLANGVLDYIDLDIDVLVWKDFSYQILDLDEFEENGVKFDYPPEICEEAIKTLKELLNMIEMRAFPFDDVSF